jgi:phosphomannomutase
VHLLLPRQDALGAITAALPEGTRVFLRPSGTEPVIRLLVEFAAGGDIDPAAAAADVRVRVGAMLEGLAAGSS